MLRRIREMSWAQQGFTLVELLAVIAIIGVLAAIAVPRFMDATTDAQVAQIQADLSTIDSAIVMYYAANGAYPTAMTDLSTYFASTPTSPKTPAYSINETTYRAEWNGHTAQDKAGIKTALTTTTPTPE
ncbi:MAG TPA: hypothetical protein DEA44_12320 [Firmicutes bacterium]|nr:hypothetical protein [Bacillota bacterium]